MEEGKKFGLGGLREVMRLETFGEFVRALDRCESESWIGGDNSRAQADISMVEYSKLSRSEGLTFLSREDDVSAVGVAGVEDEGACVRSWSMTDLHAELGSLFRFK